ncbi:MAG: hypothetical protein IJQ20_04145 [Paludibacteraceae bacterium]|nr:hypothetical protein [Paludibacteraceae bacterium]
MTKVIQLTRLRTDGKAVTGFLDLPIDKDVLRIATLENAEYLIPAGKYPLKMTWSPRWNKMMPEICNVPEREGIRIHMGTLPQHSQGCVLVSAYALSNIQAIITKNDKYEKEELYIEIL